MLKFFIFLVLLLIGAIIWAAVNKFRGGTFLPSEGPKSIRDLIERPTDQADRESRH